MNTYIVSMLFRWWKGIIAVDTEFSGLCLNDQLRPSLFDTIDDRYDKLRRSVDRFCLLQVGITTFERISSENKYDASSFNFYLFPASFCSLNRTICFQTSAIEFLNKHAFDYDKCLREGIPYLNHEQEQQIIKDLQEGYQINTVDSQGHEEAIQNLCSVVASWTCQEKSENFLTLPSEDVPPASVFVVHMELRKRFCQIWTSTNQFNQIVVEKVSPERRKYLESIDKRNKDSEKDQQILYALGFTKVFRMLERFKKPIVGHNMFLDLLFLYDKCHNPLPSNFSKFKEEIHKLFPLIFDTKHLQHSLRKELEILKVSRIRRLEDLYHVLNSQKALGMALYQPSVDLVNKENSADDTSKLVPHQAGYDAYLCGCVFIRLCHLEHFQSQGCEDTAAVTFPDYLSTMRKYANCVNVIRATINHTKLDGDEPQSDRPPLLHVSVTRSTDVLSLNQLSSWFSVYGAVDIKMMNSTQAVVATSSYMVARDILYSFKKHPIIRVTGYKFWQHSKYGKIIWWSTFFVASGSCLLLLYDVVKK